MVDGTGYVKVSEVQGESFDVGAKVTYRGRQLTVSQAPDRDGEIKMFDISAISALCDALPRMTALTELKCACHYASISTTLVGSPLMPPGITFDM